MKTQEQKTQEVLDYAKKTSKHLFKVKNKFLKNILITHKDTQYMVRLFISENGKVESTVKDMGYMIVKEDIKYYAAPSWLDIKSVKYFKKIKNLINELEKGLTENFYDSPNLITKFSEDFMKLEVKI